MVVAQAKLNPLTRRQERAQDEIDRLVASRQQTPEATKRLDDLKEILAVLSGLEAKTADELDHYLALADDVLRRKRPFDRSLFKDAVGPVTAEQLYVNQKISDLISNAEMEQSDYRRGGKLNVFFGEEKRYFGAKISVFIFNTMVLIGSTLGLLGVLHWIAETESLPHEVERTLFHLSVNPAHVFADDAERNQLHAAHEKNGDKNRGPAANPLRGIGKETQKEGVDNSEEREPEHEETSPDREPQGREGKGDDGVDREADHFRKGIVGRTSETRLAFIGHGDLSIADPAHHSAEKAVPLRHAQKRVDDLTIHEAEVARVGRNGSARYAMDESIKNFCAPEFERALARPLGALRVGDVITFLPAREHRLDQFRRILQVGIHDHDRITRGVFESGGGGNLLPEIARETQAAHARVGARQLVQDARGFILAAVVHEDELERAGALQAIRDLSETAMRFRQNGRFVVARE